MWDELDVRAAVQRVTGSGYTPPAPTVCARTDGQCLFYPKAINILMGLPSAGKSWVAQLAAKQEIEAGYHVIYLDWEDSLDRVVYRLIHVFGVHPEVVAVYFHYRQPSGKPDLADLTKLEDQVAVMEPRLVVFDSTGESMGSQGMKQNDDDQVVAWITLLARPLSRRGPAVLLLDHVVKDPEARGRWAIGSQRKIAVVDGAAFTIETIRPFGKGVSGLAKLTTAKDRAGTYVLGQVAAEAVVDASEDGRMTLTLRPAAPLEAHGDGIVHTILAERVSRWLEIQPTPVSKRDTIHAVNGNDKALSAALDELIASGHITLVPNEGRGGGHHLQSLKPYRNDDDPGPAEYNEMQD